MSRDRELPISLSAVDFVSRRVGLVDGGTFPRRYIVDELRGYKHPVFAYIPPHGELRGGAWVVIDPTINSEMMEMYVDDNARGGILEPPGICDVKFRKPDLIKAMHRQDSKLQQLATELEVAESSFAEAEADSLRQQIAKREAALLPLYVQVG